jgi:hypothetical protein
MREFYEKTGKCFWEIGRIHRLHSGSSYNITADQAGSSSVNRQSSAQGDFLRENAGGKIIGRSVNAWLEQPQSPASNQDEDHNDREKFQNA